MDKQTVDGQFVKCEICEESGDNYESIDLSEHIRDKHATTVAKYRKDYPSAPINWKEVPLQERIDKNIEDDPIKQKMRSRIKEGRSSPNIPELDQEFKEKILSEIERFEEETSKELLSIEEKLKKYPECAEKDNARFLIRQCGILQQEYMEHKKRMVNANILVSEDEKQKAKIVLDSISQLKDIMKSLEHAYIAALEHEDVVSIYAEEQEKIRKFIQANIGEFSFRCDNCHHILEAGGLDKWYYQYEDEERDTKYHIWSRELWFLWKRRIIPYWIIPFVLRIGILGPIYTFRKRNNLGTERAMNVLGITWEDLKTEEEEYQIALQTYEDEECEEFNKFYE